MAVEQGEDCGVLLGCGVDGVDEEAAIEGGADAFFPVAVARGDGYAVGCKAVGDDRAKVGLAVGFAELGFE